MTVTKLSIANGSMRLLKERLLTQNELTNNTREPARNFNAVWDDGAINACLEAGQWKFAKRTVMLDTTPSVTPDFGYRYAFEKPSDWVRVAGVWSDESISNPLTDYREEAGFLWANLETIFVAYISNDAAYGNDYSLWPQSFNKFVQAHIASEIAGPLTSDGKDILKARKMFLNEALSTDAMADPTRFMPAGSWVLSRGGSMRRREG